LSGEDSLTCAAVSQFLEAELFHSLGSYRTAGVLLRSDALAKELLPQTGLRVAVKRMRKLNESLAAHADTAINPSRHPGAPDAKGEFADLSTAAMLIDDFYMVCGWALETVLSPQPSFEEEVDQSSLAPLGKCLFWEQDPTSASRDTNESLQSWWSQTGRSQPSEPSPNDVATAPRPVRLRVNSKCDRYRGRRERLQSTFQLRTPESSLSRCDELVRGLLETDLSQPAAGLRPQFVLEALVNAHLNLHRVEHALSGPFEAAVGMSEGRRAEAQVWLCQAEALNTFVFVICRSLPWIFAADAEEREEIIASLGEGPNYRRTDPASAEHLQAGRLFDLTWPAQQVSLLALHRRAFGHALADRLEASSRNDRAFKDFHKLQRLLRVARRSDEHFHDPPWLRQSESETMYEEQLAAIRCRLRERRYGERDDPALKREQAFLDGLDALAETHIGELYRADHAHPIALAHFCDAYDRLIQLSDKLNVRSGEDQAPAVPGTATETLEVSEDEDQPIPQEVVRELRESHWRINLMLSKGKGFYEVGNLKRSVKWFLVSWRALVIVFQDTNRTEDETTANARWFAAEDCKRAIEALTAIRNDPDFSKGDLRALVEPVIKTTTDVDVPAEFGVLAAEILLRLGHVLFILQLGGKDPAEMRIPAGIPEPTDANYLAYECLRVAARLDPSNNLVDADLLKIEYGRGQAGGAESIAYSEIERPPLAERWPFGRGDSEQTIRVIEYLLLRWLCFSQPGTEDAEHSAEAVISRELIRRFLTHTDSINVKQSQVYKYLMREPQEPLALRGGGVDGAEPSIEFICLRRYSSFFPFVPRPSAFRSLGGGYFLRLNHSDQPRCPSPYGIAIDPGPDFIANLYRCGFSLSDINMIVITHDHADHAAALDPVLSLMGYRARFGDRTYRGAARRRATGDQAPNRLLIVGNESVVKRLSYFNDPHMTSEQSSRPDAVRVLSFDQFEAFDPGRDAVRSQSEVPEALVPHDLRLRPVISIRHRDSGRHLAYGMRISLGEDGPSIGFTGDTGGFNLCRDEQASRWEVEFDDSDGILTRTGSHSWKAHWEEVLTADVLVAHVSALPLSQLQAAADDGRGAEDHKNWQGYEADREKLWEVWRNVREDVRNQINFALWLKDSKGNTAKPLEDIPAEFRWPRDHLYFAGLLEFARAYKGERDRLGEPGLFLVGELREELGSFRSKIATNVDRHIFGAVDIEQHGCKALTADVGLRLVIGRRTPGSEAPAVRVLCSICDLDNDRTIDERFHDPGDVREVCVKGENEGIFYNCLSHDPSNHDQPVFLERIERYDVFANELFR